MSVPDQWNAIAVDLMKRGHMAAARAAFRRAVDLAPERADLQSNYGNILRRSGRPDEAWSRLDQALALDPNFVHGWYNYAVALSEQGVADEAVATLERLLAQDPANGNWRFAHACALLQAGRWAEGFAAYECRLEERDFGASPIPLWDGSALGTRTLLLHAEQGLGDTVMFHRFVRDLRKAHPDAQLQYIAHAPLSDLLDAHRVGEKLDGIDCHLPIMSLGDRLGVCRVDGAVYLRPKHRMALDLSPGSRGAIGIVWRAKATWKSMTVDEALHGQQKSMPLEAMLELTRVSGYDLVSLQAGGTAEIEALGATQLVKDMAPLIADFSDLASYMVQCKAVVSVDTGPLHLAGALGVPAVAALHHAPSWQWGTGRGRPAWYSSVYCIRQETPGDWASVVDSAIGKIEEILANRR